VAACRPDEELTRLHLPESFNEIFTMNHTLKDQAERLFEKQSKPAPTSYEQEQLAMRANFERLKAERLAREAASSK
jgi:hypothetical protein